MLAEYDRAEIVHEEHILRKWAAEMLARLYVIVDGVPGVLSL